VQLDREREQQADHKLQAQVENRSTLRELLFKLIVGTVSPAEATTTGQMLGLD
jgi:hypothetical protein